MVAAVGRSLYESALGQPKLSAFFVEDLGCNGAVLKETMFVRYRMEQVTAKRYLSGFSEFLGWFFSQILERNWAV